MTLLKLLMFVMILHVEVVEGGKVEGSVGESLWVYCGRDRDIEVLLIVDSVALRDWIDESTMLWGRLKYRLYVFDPYTGRVFRSEGKAWSFGEEEEATEVGISVRMVKFFDTTRKYLELTIDLQEARRQGQEEQGSGGSYRSAKACVTIGEGVIKGELYRFSRGLGRTVMLYRCDAIWMSWEAFVREVQRRAGEKQDE